MNEKIDLNQADAAALATLPGIGKGLAARIVTYRETVRPFTEVIELAAVPGISERMVREIEAQLTVGAVEEAEMADNVVEPIETIAEEEEAVVEAIAETEPEIAKEEAEMMEEEPIREPLAERPLPPSPAPAAALAHSSFKEQLFTAVIGALLGAALTLVVLWLLNGSLRLNESAQVDALRLQSVEVAATTEAEQASARTDLNTLTDQFAAMTTRESDTAVLLETLQSDVSETQAQLADTTEKTAELETAAADLDERLTAVAASAENFDAFLNGMRDLLWELQGPPPTPTATATASPTMMATATVSATATISGTTAVTATATVTATPYATRTPRPTATPFGETTPTAQPTATPNG